MSETTTEPATDSTTEHNEESTHNNSNHIAGCGIFLIILAMVVFIISVAVYSYFDHKDAFIKFSEETITATEIATTSDAAAITAIEQKFSNFGALVKDEKLATMDLSAAEINLAIAHFKKLEEFQNKLYVTAITDKHIEARSSFQINAGFDGVRHVNGKLLLKPVIAQGSIFPIVDKVETDTGEPVPEKVLKAIPVLMFAGYRNDETIKDVFHKLTKVELKDGMLLITSEPDSTETPIIDLDVTKETEVGFQLFGLLTFIFVTTVAFALWFSSYKKKQRASE
jgi:heme/copper-type cytochrome/quinol oxidase subunit 3